MLLTHSRNIQAYQHLCQHEQLNACALVACAYVAPMPETDTGIVETVCYTNAGAVVVAPTAHAPTVVRQTQHSYAAGLAVTKVRQVIANNNCVVTEHDQPSASYIPCCRTSPQPQ